MKIDYAVISNDQNPEYKNLFPYIQKRWNQMGIKTIYLDCHINEGVGSLFEPLFVGETDKFGNITFNVTLGDHPDKVLWKHFRTTILRFWFVNKFGDAYNDIVLIMSDGDLFPINKQYIYKPSVMIDMDKSLMSNHLVTTNHYIDHNFLATYTYGTGVAFKKLLPFTTFNDLIYDATNVAWKNGWMYLMEEQYLNYMVNMKHMVVVDKVLNRIEKEMVHEMNNLYEFQIDYLNRWQDLCPFIEFHNMRASTMTKEKWNKLFKLLAEYDMFEITPPNYYYELIPEPWKDDVIWNGQFYKGNCND